MTPYRQLSIAVLFSVLTLLAFMPSVTAESKSAAETDQGHPLRKHFDEVGGATVALPCLNTELVQKELGLTEAQKERIARLRRELRDAFNRARSRPVSPEDMRKVVIELTQKIEAVLQPDQLNRLLEIWSQLCGSMILSETNVAHFCGLTNDQEEQIKLIADNANESIKAAIQISYGPEGDGHRIHKDFKEGSKKREAIINSASERIQRILTPKQLDMLKKVRGKEVDSARLNEEFGNAIELQYSLPNGAIVK